MRCCRLYWVSSYSGRLSSFWAQWNANVHTFTGADDVIVKWSREYYISASINAIVTVWGLFHRCRRFLVSIWFSKLFFLICFSVQKKICLEISCSRPHDHGNLWVPCFINLFMSEAVIIQKSVIDLQSKSIDWFLYDNGLRHERVNSIFCYFVSVSCHCY